MMGSKAFEPENMRDVILLALSETFNSKISDVYAEDYIEMMRKKTNKRLHEK